MRPAQVLGGCDLGGERDDQPSGNNPNAKLGARRGWRLRAVCGSFRPGAGSSIPQSDAGSGFDPAQSPSGPGLFWPPLLPLPPLPPQPNLVETFGRWLDQGTTKFRTDMQGAQETFDKLGNQTRDAAKDATDAMIGLPNARVVTARERCAPARNGSADCQAAVDKFCRAKGFQVGKSLDTQSELKCPAKVLLEGRSPNEAECRTEIFVTRAVCQ